MYYKKVNDINTFSTCKWGGEPRGVWDITHTFIKLILNKQNQFPLKSKRADYNGNSKHAKRRFLVCCA